MLIKISIEDSYSAHSGFVIILSEWSAHVNSMEGTSWSKFDGISAEEWTSASILRWVNTIVRRTELLLKTQWSCRGFQYYISHPVLYQVDQETSSAVLRIAFQLFSRSWLGGTASLSCCHLIYITCSICLSLVIILFTASENFKSFLMIIVYCYFIAIMDKERKDYLYCES